MKIIFDIYGGDNAPLAPLKGAEMAVKELGVEIIAVGNEAEMKEICEKEDRGALMVEKEKVLLAIKEQKDKYGSKVILAMSEVLDILKAIENAINK